MTFLRRHFPFLLKPRSIKKLLIVLKDQIKEKYSNSGMCAEVNFLSFDNKITHKEAVKLLIYLKRNKPNNKTFWFEPELLQPRLDWLNQQISKEWTK